MLLTEIISSIKILGRPYLELSDKGLKLRYNNETLSRRIHLSTGFIRPKLDIYRDNSSIIISHRHISQYLLANGAHKVGLEDAIDSFYAQQNIDRAKWLATESFYSTSTDTPIPTEILTVQRVGLGPNPNQLIADLSIKIAKTTEDEAPPSHLVFLLDCSGSMNGDNRIGMLKRALLNTIDQLPPQTLVSVYFYNHELKTIFTNTAARDITEYDRENILMIIAKGKTDISVAIRPIVNNMQMLERSTIVWLTDGADDKIKHADDLTKLFENAGCLSIPQLIAVGIGDYNRELLNGVATDVRFKSNLMLHIESPVNIEKLFNLIAHFVGVVRKHVIVAMQADDKMTFQDLGMMQTNQVKHFLIETPMPLNGSTHIACRILVDEHVYFGDVSLPANFNQTNTELLINYFQHIQHKIKLNLHKNPDAAEEMRAHALASIPSMVSDRRLLALRNSFMPAQTNYCLFEEDLMDASLPSLGLQTTDATGPTFFARSSNNRQDRYSHALPNENTDSNHSL